MTHAEELSLLSDTFRKDRDHVSIPQWKLSIIGYPFESAHCHLLPGGDRHCYIHGKSFPVSEPPDGEGDGVHVPDARVEENRGFRYHIVNGWRKAPADGIILLFHGLNEKNWDKYLPWARRLNLHTGKPVVLFPLAFHMDRAPALWSDPKTMHRLSRARHTRFPEITCSSLANAAISERLVDNPKRFLWSGLQSFNDLVSFCREIRSGIHAGIQKNARIDFFAYSIGAFLALIALMADPGNLFSRTRLFCFCGGCVLNRSYPTSRYIMDSKANVALYSLYVEHLEHEIASDPSLAHYFSSLHPEGMYFKSLLDLHKEVALREDRLREIHRRIRAVTLKKDTVMLPMEVAHTLQGRELRIPVKMKTLDFPYDYSHANPFPRGIPQQDQVLRSMNNLFRQAAKFLRN